MVPDGVLPFWLWGSGWAMTILLLGLIAWNVREEKMLRVIPLVGVMAAVMTVAMSFALVPIGYEPHLTVLTGIVLGPVYGFLAGFIFMLLRWLMGDGAVTLIGLNTLLIGAEIALGALLFRLVRRALTRWVPLAAAVSTFGALAVATLLFLGVIALSGMNPFQSEIGELGAYNFETGSLQDPFAQGVFRLDWFGREEEVKEAPAILGQSPFAVYARAVLLLGLIGWTLEALVTGLVVGFLIRVRRDLIVPVPFSRAAEEGS